MVQVEKYMYVANMIGQKGIKTGSNGVPVRYEAIEKCFGKISHEALQINASIHMPRIGCGLAGGKWEEIEPIIERTCLQKNVEVYVYDFELTRNERI
jgi:O-acetyl-ADP-ribose deacetylase (regulator of RNase III)